MTGPLEAPGFDVRLARAGEEAAICDVCRKGFAVSSRGLLSPATVERQVRLYYDPDRVRHEIVTAGRTPTWQGYVVAVSEAGEVLGAAGGGVTDPAMGNIYVLYLAPSLRGRGIGTALLDFVTEQQRSAGATEQWVSVTARARPDQTSDESNPTISRRAEPGAGPRCGRRAGPGGRLRRGW